MVPTTIEVAAFRKVGRYVDDRCVAWALNMIDAGTITPSICALAAACPPFSAFEMPELVDRALEEVGAKPIPTETHGVRIIASIRAKQALDGELSIDVALAELHQLFIEHDHLSEIFDFYLLHEANEDLKLDSFQWYWPSATRENFKHVVTDRFQQWIAENPLPD